MNKTVEEINKMIMEDAPMEEINDAIGYIDICSCFDPIFEPPIDFLEECRYRYINDLASASRGISADRQFTAEAPVDTPSGGCLYGKNTGLSGGNAGNGLRR